MAPKRPTRVGLLALAWLLSAGLLAACSSSGDPKPCSGEQDCAADQYCGPDGRCHPDAVADGQDGAEEPTSGDDGGPGDQDQGPPPCERDTDCPADQVCDQPSGRCEPGTLPCNADYNCPDIDHQFCDPDGHVCKTRSQLCEPCARDLECPFPTQGDKCIAYPDGTFCGQRCGTLDCPAGYDCDPNAGGTAANPGQCRSNTGSCAGTFVCHGDQDCLPSQYCNLSTGVCLTRCRQDIQSCPGGQVCHYTGRCGPPCAADADCGGDLICCTAAGVGFCTQDSIGKCRPEGCVAHAECLVTQGDSLGYCDKTDNTCKLGCRAANPANVNDCKSGMKCECTGGTVSCDQFDCCPDSGPCLCNPAIQDCSGVTVCNDGTCLEIPCHERGDVSVACARNQMCCGWPLQDGYPCPAGTTEGQCYLAEEPFCLPCSEHATCDVPGYGYGEKGYCGEDQDGNKYCYPGCRTAQDCPSTWACNYSFMQGCSPDAPCTGAATCEVVDRRFDDEGAVQESTACVCATEADCEPDFDGFAPHCLPFQACDSTVEPTQCHQVNLCKYAKACQCPNCCGELAGG